MRKLLIIAGTAAVVAAPVVAQAATRCRQVNRNNEVAGTVIGAVAGGLFGNAISHGRDRGAATAVGALGGAYIGNRVAASGNQPCPEGYEAYDDAVDGQYAPSAYPNDYNRPADGAYNRDGSSAYTADDRYRRGNSPTYSPPSNDGYRSNDRGYAPDRSTQTYMADTYSTPYRSPAPGYRSTYSSEDTATGYADASGQTWTDSDGRRCRWVYSADAYGASNYRQVCR